MSAVTTWKTTPADNNSAPPNGWPEGQAAASVNDCARQLMTDVVIEFQKNQVKVLGTVAGTNVITAVMTPALTAYSAGMMVVFTPAGGSTSATTLNIDGLGALDVLKGNGVALSAGDLIASVPAILLLDSGADDWILLNPQHASVLSLTAANAVTAGSLSVSGSATITGNMILNGSLATDNTTADEVGFKGLPRRILTGSSTLVLGDAGGLIEVNNVGYTVTIPANAAVAYPIGTAITFAGYSSGYTIAITSDTLRLAGTTSTGPRVLVENGLATALKIDSTLWLISGTGLS